MRRFLLTLAYLSTRHAVAVLVGSALLTVFAGYYAVRAVRNVETDLSYLMPKDRPASATLHEARSQLATADLMLVVVEIAPDLPPLHPAPWQDASALNLDAPVQSDITSIDDPDVLAAPGLDQ